MTVIVLEFTVLGPASALVTIVSRTLGSLRSLPPAHVIHGIMCVSQVHALIPSTPV